MSRKHLKIKKKDKDVGWIEQFFLKLLIPILDITLDTLS